MHLQAVRRGKVLAALVAFVGVGTLFLVIVMVVVVVFIAGVVIVVVVLIILRFLRRVARRW